MNQFNVRKAAQVISFFIDKRGGKTDIIDAIKLAYLADRKSLELYDVPILDDDLYSMEHGPVNSATYDYVKGAGRDKEIWNRYIVKSGNDLTLATGALSDNFSQLSDAEISVLNAVIDEFKDIRSFKLVDWIHANCKEWQDPGDSSIPLPYERVFKFLNKNNSDKRAKRLAEIRNLKDALAKAQ